MNSRPYNNDISKVENNIITSSNSKTQIQVK